MITNYADIRSHYESCQRKAKKSSFFSRFKGNVKYLLALDEIVDITKLSQVDLGEIEVPASLIVGTKTSARKTSFSSDFMPLLSSNSEFAYKWIEVCKYHLSDSGITDAPKVYEYLGKFYVEEGNKRVSVLKSYGAVYIPCKVIRLLPPVSEDKEIKLYYEFLDYYNLSKLYSIQFKKLGYYKKLQKLMEFDDDHVWDRMERIKLIGFYERFTKILKDKGINAYYPDALVVMMEIYGSAFLFDMSDHDLTKAINSSVNNILQDKAHFKILCISDEEDNAIWNGLNNEKLKEYDFIISAGDLKSEYLEYIVTVSNRPLFYVHGNHDEKYDVKSPEGCDCLDDKLITYRGIRILGLGGSYRYKDDAKYMYSEKEMAKRIRKLRYKIWKAGGVDIIVTHAPAKGYGDLNDYAHQGFECFTKLIKRYHPKYFFFGHVHTRYDYSYTGFYELEGTQIINVSKKQDIIY